jgi:membrane-bound lytic murein transglycosylase D
MEEGNAPEVRIHVVRRGDTLYGIARRYGVPLSRIYRWNNLGPRSVIRPGQEIITQR